MSILRKAPRMGRPPATRRRSRRICHADTPHHIAIATRWDQAHNKTRIAGASDHCMTKRLRWQSVSSTGRGAATLCDRLRPRPAMSRPA